MDFPLKNMPMTEEHIYDSIGGLGGQVPSIVMVYPRLMFTCHGILRGLTVIGYVNSSHTTISLELGPWRSQLQSL